jgi:hypothetical protein
LTSDQHKQGWYLTAPLDPVPVRRGDALGLRAGADYFADLLAPGLSNATSDARWITLLCWCLRWSHVAWSKASAGDLSSRKAQQARYAWLRPLELLWVDRTLEAGQATGQLRGRRSIERWRGSGRPVSKEREGFRFGMTADQFKRYRQIGTYGAYRVVFRTLSGLTTGDGWTPAASSMGLARLVNDQLPRAAQLHEDHFERATQWGRWKDNEARYWVDRGWTDALAMPLKGWLPTPDDAICKPLPQAERILLEPLLFDAQATRRATAKALATAGGVTTHAELCDALANSSALSKKVAAKSLAPLPAFTRLADASMHAMRGLWEAIHHDGDRQAPGVDRLARSAELCGRLDKVREAGQAWLRAPARESFKHEQVATRLAKTMQLAKAPADQLRALAQHHHEHGGGRRWFREQAGNMVPLIADTGIAASDYRFRLRSLARLAAQCNIAGMLPVLDAVGRNGFEDDAAAGQDDDDGGMP